MQTDIDFTALFRDAIKDDNVYYESLSIARMNTQGKIWVVGGFVYRTLAARLYGTPLAIKDMDFLAERLADSMVVPVGWTRSASTFGSPKFFRGGLFVDILPFDEIRIPMQMPGPPTIEEYLACVTLTVQAIAYDICEQRVIGDIGMQALRTKTVAYNMPKVNKEYFAKKGYTRESYIREKADGLGFRVILPSNLL